MKIKLIKKINTFFLGILLVGGLVFSLLFLWSSWENQEIDRSLLESKARRPQTEAVIVKASEPASGILEPVNLDPVKILPDQQAEASGLENAVDEADRNNPFQSFAFAAIGDAESYREASGYNEELKAVMNHAHNKRPDFVLFTGDIINAGSSDLSGNIWRIKNVKTLIESYFNNYYIAFGEHDIECGNGCVDAWNEIFFDKPTKEADERKLYFSFNYHNTHFVLLSTDHPEMHSVDDAQLVWLEENLEQNSLPNTIIVQHISPVSFFKESSENCHDLSCQPSVQEKLMALYRKHKVDCVISGHENAFDHKIVDEIDFVLSGNVGNKPRYKNLIKGDIYTYFSVNGEAIHLQAINTKNEIIREIKIK